MNIRQTIADWLEELRAQRRERAELRLEREAEIRLQLKEYDTAAYIAIDGIPLVRVTDLQDMRRTLADMRKVFISYHKR